MPLVSPQVFFDAARSTFNRDGTVQIFNGDVVAIAAGTLIAADHIQLDRTQGVLVASGHVLLLNSSQVFAGESMTYQLDTGEFTLSRALMLANDPAASDAIIQKILGFSQAEFSFETARRQQLAALNMAKEDLRMAFRKALHAPTAEREALVERYTLLLEREELITKQVFPGLMQLSEQKRSAYKRRREYWQQSQGQKLAGSLIEIGYFAIAGDEITRLTETEFRAKNAFATPCLCDAGETPAWGFRSAKIEAETGGYARLSHPVLEIKGIPVLYLPYLKIPIKSQRQSGFLLPNITYSSRNGNVFTQPVYFVFDEASDATLTSDFIEKRGLRLGLEYRIQTRQHSGWEFNLEGLRDRLWLGERAEREALVSSFKSDLTTAREAAHAAGTTPPLGDGLTPSDPAWWQTQGLGYCLLDDERYSSCLENDIDNRLAAPPNSWRGKFNWSGQTILAPRLSLMSQGLVVSDHRYIDDMAVPNFTNPLAELAPPLFADAKVQAHLDGKDFYAGAGSAFGDHSLALRRYSGYQLPFSLKLQSRLLPLVTRAHLPVPVYAQLALEHRRIELFHPPELAASLADNTRIQRLGDGTWQRAKLSLISPLVVEQIFQTNHFTELEFRRIHSNELRASGYQAGTPLEGADPNSVTNQLHSLRTGLRFALPIDGSMELDPTTSEEGESIRRFLEHAMNWELILSWRPYAARRGDYGQAYDASRYQSATGLWQPLPGTQRLTYFASDNPDYIENGVVPEDQRMYPHQKLILKTSHTWALRKKKWHLIPGRAKPAAAPPLAGREPTLRERAREELLYSLDRPIAGHADMLGPQGQWFVNRYELANIEYVQPLSFDAQMSYDYIKEKQRQKQQAGLAPISVAQPLAEPWSPAIANLGLRWEGWGLGVGGQYNLYKKLTTELNMGLAAPTIGGLALSASYKIEREAAALTDGGFKAVETRTRIVSLRSQILSHTSLGMDYGTRTRYEREPPEQRMLAISSRYLSPSNCWGLNFLWQRKFEDVDWTGTYYLALVVKFLNYQRDYGNLTRRFNADS